MIIAAVQREFERRRIEPAKLTGTADMHGVVKTPYLFSARDELRGKSPGPVNRTRLKGNLLKPTHCLSPALSIRHSPGLPRLLLNSQVTQLPETLA